MNRLLAIFLALSLALSADGYSTPPIQHNPWTTNSAANLPAPSTVLTAGQIARVDTSLFASNNINLQAMINSLPAATKTPLPGGGTIELGKGVFYTSSGNLFTGSGGQALRIIGQGINQTYLVFTNPGDGLTVNGTLPYNTSLELKDITVAASYDTANFLIVNHSTSVTTFKEACFAYWPALLCQSLPLNVCAYGSAAATLLCGVNLADSEGLLDTFEDCYFTSLGAGVRVNNDHLRMINCQFTAVGVAQDAMYFYTGGYGGALPPDPRAASLLTNNWVTVGIPDLNARACITVTGGFDDDEFYGCYFVFSHAIILLDRSPITSGYMGHEVFAGGHIEGLVYRTIVASNTPNCPASLSGGTIQFVNCDNFNYSAYGADADQIATWGQITGGGKVAYSTATAPNVFEQNSKNNLSYDFYAGGTKVLSLSNNTVVIPNLVANEININAPTSSPPASISSFKGGITITNNGVVYHIPIY